MNYMRVLRDKIRRVGAVLLLAGGLSACQGRVSTLIDVQGDGSLSARISLGFSGEIAQVLREDKTQAEALETLIVSRLHDENGVATPRVEDDPRETRVEVRDSEAELVWSVWVSEAELRENTALLGVASVSSTVTGEEATVVVTTARPEKLLAAIGDAVAGRPDAAALSATYAANTVIETEIVFPGEVRSSDGRGVIKGSRYTVRTPLGEAGVVTLSATGSLRGGEGLWPKLAVVVALSTVGAYMLWRRGGKRG